MDISELIFALIRNSSDSPTAGAAFHALCHCPGLVVSQPLFDLLLMSLKAELFFQRNVISFDDQLHGGLRHFLSFFLGMPDTSQFVEARLIPTLMEYLSHDSVQLREFAVFLLARICIQFPEQTAGEFTEQVTSRALEWGFVDSLRVLADFPIARLEAFCVVLRAKFEQGPVRDAETALLVVWRLVQRAHSVFPEFAPAVFGFIPPSVLTEDTAEFLQFLEWIVHLENSELTNAALSCLIKLFSEPSSLLRSRLIPPTVFDSWRQFLQSHLSSDIVSAVLAGDGFLIQNLTDCLSGV
jgi:hypothetical protein